MNQSIWQATVRKTATYPVLDGQRSFDAVIIGGGIGGVATAWFLKQAGLKVALVEAGELGGGQTGHTTAHLTTLTDEPYYEISKRFNADIARQIWNAQAAAIKEIETLGATQNLTFDFQRVSAYKYAPNHENAPDLDKEIEALKGMSVPLVEAEVPFPHVRAFRVDHQAKFHPLKFLFRLAALIPGEGSEIFERSRVVEVHTKGIRTEQGSIDADYLCFQTNFPFEEIRIALKLQPWYTYALAFEGRYGVDEGLYYDNLSPYHYIRTHGDRLIVGGEDTHPGAKADLQSQFDRLRAFTRQSFSTEAHESHQWYGQVVESLDGLPYIGRRRGNRYMASGFSGTGMTFGALSGRILSDLILGRDNEFAEIFDPNRIKSVKTMMSYGAHIAKEFTVNAASMKSVDKIAALKAGEGMLVHHKGQPVAASKDEAGNVRAVSAVCTHVGCLVDWNAAEKTWDCPCHGSRFSAEGAVINGPAVRNLKPVDLSDEWTVGDTVDTIEDAAAPPP